VWGDAREEVDEVVQREVPGIHHKPGVRVEVEGSIHQRTEIEVDIHEKELLVQQPAGEKVQQPGEKQPTVEVRMAPIRVGNMMWDRQTIWDRGNMCDRQTIFDRNIAEVFLL